MPTLTWSVEPWVRENSDETIELGLSGGLEKVYQKFLRLRLHPGVEPKPLQYRARKDLGFGLGGKFGIGEGDISEHLVPSLPGVPVDDLGQGDNYKMVKFGLGWSLQATCAYTGTFPLHM